MTDDSNAGQRDDAQPNQGPKPARKPFKKDGRKEAKPAAKTERIAKVLARAGLASRREVERLIGLGKIAVNGRILETPAVLVSATDVITVEGQTIGKAEATRLWRYHKPVGLITTHSDPQGRPTLFEKLPEHLPRVISVGRLDLNSEGLLLLTNDGELARALEKPSSGWVRRYRVRALGHTTQARLNALKDGTTVDGVIYGPMEATLDKVAEKADGRANVWLTVAITEGKNREVRKVLESIGLKVNRLIRLAYGPFQLGNLETGEVEEVGPRVIRELLADIVPLKNLPPEGASQTRDAPRSRAPREEAGQGRRGGGDRFEKRPSRGKPVFAEKREYKDRDFDERPRFDGDGIARDRKPARDGDFVPRRDGGERKSFEKKPYGKKPYAARGDARSDYTPRPDRGAGNDRKPYAQKTFEKKPYAPRPQLDEAGAYERAKREFGSPERKPRGDRPARSGDARSEYTPRPERDGGAGGSYKKPFAKKPYAAREGGNARSEYTPRPDREGATGGGGYKKPYAAKKPYASRDGGDRPRGDFNKQPGGRPGGGEPRGPRPGAPRSGDPRSGGSRSGGPGSGGKPSFRPKRES